MVKVAKRFHVSDVAVAKACRRHKIPLPGRGYWARVVAGQKVEKSPLPATKEGWIETITFTGMPDTATRIDRSEIPEIQTEKSSENRVVVSDEPSELHPLVRRTLVLLSGSKPSEDGILQPSKDALGVYVSPDQLTRGIAILDALVKALTDRGHVVTVSDEPAPTTVSYSYWDRFAKWKPLTRTRVTIAGEEIGFGLIESTKKVPHVPSREEKRKLDNGDRYGIPEFDEIPGGELSLFLSVPEGLGVRTHWNDAKHQRVEGCLNSFVSGLVAAAHAINKGREEEERRRREREEEERRRVERERHRWKKNSASKSWMFRWQVGNELKMYERTPRPLKSSPFDITESLIRKASSASGYFGFGVTQIESTRLLLLRTRTIERQEQPIRFILGPSDRSSSAAERINDLSRCISSVFC
jgi:hypothetical protein